MKNALKHLGIEKLNEMQEDCISAYKDNNVVLMSPTGTGKTLAFLLSTINKLDKDLNQCQLLILAPTRELAIQIHEVIKTVKTEHSSVLCYGQHEVKIEKNRLANNPHIIVGTPGRINDHLNRRHFATNFIKDVVIDEYDKSLEMGFSEEINNIFKRMHQYDFILTSATDAIEIPGFLASKNPTYVKNTKKHKESSIKVQIVKSEETDKLKTLFDLLCFFNTQNNLVFCNHRDAVNRISDILKNDGVDHDVFHGGLEQEERERSLIKFRNGSYNTLICTDLAARGLDIPNIDNVVHYQIANTEDAYTHRNGRTGRMTASGSAYLILSEEEYQPKYIEEQLEEFDFKRDCLLPELSKVTTLYFGGGKKDKISKVDFVGFLCQKGGLEKTEIGKIDVLDRCSYVAVPRGKAQNLIKKLSGQKLKKKKVKIQFSR